MKLSFTDLKLFVKKTAQLIFIAHLKSEFQGLKTIFLFLLSFILLYFVLFQFKSSLTHPLVVLTPAQLMLVILFWGLFLTKFCYNLNIVPNLLWFKLSSKCCSFFSKAISTEDFHEASSSVWLVYSTWANSHKNIWTVGSRLLWDQLLTCFKVQTLHFSSLTPKGNK